jgi:hypothetical protein
LRSATTAVERLCTTLIAFVVAPPPIHRSADRRDGPRSERGDVPGWVMITMMTAIVVIALLITFKGVVLDAVRNAFNSITNQNK